MSSLLFGNGTDIVHWKPNPDSRGTSDILTTCLITLLLCVWTAVHLNVSPPGSFWKPVWRKVGWLILAVLAPEMVAYTAWWQRLQALRIMEVVNEAFHRPNPPPWYTKAIDCINSGVASLGVLLKFQSHKPTRQPTLEAQKATSPTDSHPWTMVHGFYASMGGLAISMSAHPPEADQFIPSWACGTWSITPIALSILAQTDKDQIPRLTEAEIKSKSKANGLAKALVCAQAMWFLTACITRLAQRIPISLLELNTFGHAICALFIYLLWWEKPFEVDIPTIVDSDVLLDMYALAWVNTKGLSPFVQSTMNTYREYLQANKRSRLLDEFMRRKNDEYQESQFLVGPNSIGLFLDDEGKKLSYNHGYFALGQDLFPSVDHVFDTHGQQPSITCEPNEIIPGTDLRLTIDPLQIAGLVAYPSISVTGGDINRWKMAVRAVDRLQEPHLGLHRLNGPFRRHVPNMPLFGNILSDFPLALGFSAAAIIYGGLHALAWFAQFRSPTEQLLWRISSVAVMSGIPIMAAIYRLLIYFIFRHRFILRYPQRKSADSRFSRLLCMGLLLSVVIAYTLARLYLVVECFIQLSHLPAGVYEVPKWSTYFPHIA